MTALLRTLASSLIAAALAACVSPRILTDAVSEDATLNLADRFSARLPSDWLAFYELGIDASMADTVFAELDKDNGLTLRFETNGQAFYTRQYGFEDGLRMTQDGKIELSLPRPCAGDSPPTACASTTYTLFVNQHGDLVVVQAKGMKRAGIIPVEAPRTSLGRFRRKQ